MIRRWLRRLFQGRRQPRLCLPGQRQLLEDDGGRSGELPAAQSEIGTLSADGKTCTYASGDVVTFTPALVLPLGNSPTWNFSVTTGSGAACLAYQDNGSGGITLNVQGQTVKEVPSGQIGLALICPDGTTFATSNAFNLLSCPDAGLFRSPRRQLVEQRHQREPRCHRDLGLLPAPFRCSTAKRGGAFLDAAARTAVG